MLSESEIALAADASVLLAKNRIIQAVYELFGSLSESYREQAADLPVYSTHLHPKISRGENYRGLPWVMLDYPRWFSERNALAIRTLFWWGNAFSLHLLLQGNQLPLLNTQAVPEGWYFSTAADPWQHHFDDKTVLPADELTAEWQRQQQAKGFYKISTYLPLAQWEAAEVFLVQKFSEAVRMIGPETDL